MAFPSSPTNGQTYSANGVTYVYDAGMGVWDPQGTVASSSPVSSVAGRTGAVTLTATDIGTGTFASNITAGANLTVSGTTTMASATATSLAVSGTTTLASTTTGAITASSISVSGTATIGTLSVSAINNIPIGNSTANSGAFTSLAASGAVSFSSTASITGRLTKSVSGGVNSPSARFAIGTASQADIHIASSTNGSSATNTQQYGLTFSPSGGNTQAGILISENNSDGTAIGFFCTNSYAAGPQLRGSIDPNGNTYFAGGLGINTSAPSTAGQILATNSITAYYSDERLKTKIGNIENALDKIDQLAGFLYVENDLAKSFGFNNTNTQVALSAQAVQRVQPEATALAPFDRDEGGLSKSGDNYLTVQYERLVPLLVEGIKELRREINQLKGK
jgi:hypothetical protein